MLSAVQHFANAPACVRPQAQADRMPSTVCHIQVVQGVGASIQNMAQVASVADVQQGLREQALAATGAPKLPVMSS